MRSHSRITLALVLAIGMLIIGIGPFSFKYAAKPGWDCRRTGWESLVP
jgi:hypothetical protein